ncbi:MAG: hypothetical protein KQH59_18350 [Desulfobulbaceae bacterium]|nr:hypothetical protein [Desulfobulbaceae bacterium]
MNRGIHPKRTANAYGGEYTSHCPCCGDDGKGKNSDRFHIWPDRPGGGKSIGRYWCRQCGITGDAIQFLMDVDNLSFSEACAELGIALPDGGVPRPRPTTPQVVHNSGHEPREYALPAAGWMEKAAAFLEDCQQRLTTRDDALAWLAKRGIDEATARRYGLGYNESSRGRDRYRPLSLWGLPAARNDQGKEKKLWLPRGWVVPLIDEQGRVIQLRIRRRNEDIAKFAEDIKYLMVKGSCPATMVLHPDAGIFASVESGLDAVLLAGLFDGRIGAVTTWNAQAKPDRRADAILQRADCILDCLDYDAAGAEAQAWWSQRYRRHRRWPVPVGKDPGDAYGADVDLRDWIMAGLPPGLARKLGGDVAAAGDQKAGRRAEPVADHGQPVAGETIAAAGDTKARVIETNGADGETNRVASPVTDSCLPRECCEKIGNGLGGQHRKQTDRERELERRIADLPPIMRAEVESFRELMDAHPLGAWLSGDGLAAGPVCRDESWRREHWDIFGRFKSLFYGPAHGIICDLWEPEFKRTGAALRKR